MTLGIERPSIDQDAVNDVRAKTWQRCENGKQRPG
jgi:hypothetical protein